MNIFTNHSKRKSVRILGTLMLIMAMMSSAFFGSYIDAVDVRATYETETEHTEAVSTDTEQTDN